jgi:hypothetical protein
MPISRYTGENEARTEMVGKRRGLVVRAWGFGFGTTGRAPSFQPPGPKP